MRRLTILGAGLLVLAGLASCYWNGNPGTGGLEMELSGIQPRQTGERVRVYLLADGLLFSTGRGVPFSAEVPAAESPDETRVSIQGLPVGPQYQALVGIGLVSDGIFDVTDYGESEPFEVTPDANNTVTMALEPLYYFWGMSYSTDLMGKNLKGVAADYAYVYAAEQSKLYAYTFSGGFLLESEYDLAADRDHAGVTSWRVNGLSCTVAAATYPTVIDGNNGILPFSYNGESWSFDTGFSAELGAPKSLLECGSFFILGQDQALFFRRAEGVGGRYFPYLVFPNTEPWVNVDAPGVLDMVLSDYNAYFVTDSGAFALPPAFLQDSTPTVPEHRIPLSAPAKVLSLGFRPGGASAPELHMGTTDGAWVATVTESSGTVSIGTPTQIPETAGDRIERIEISRDRPDECQAYFSRYWLYIRQTIIGYPTEVYKYPFFAVFPGKVTGMVWDPSGVLYISGTEGLSALQVSVAAS